MTNDTKRVEMVVFRVDRSRRAVVTASALAASALVAATVVAAPIPAAAAVEHTVTFEYTGEQATWTVPTGIASLTVEVAGAQGTSTEYAAGGAGGVVVVDLGADYAGQELDLLVGGVGAGSLPRESGVQKLGGGGSFVVHAGAPLVVSGGGGGAGDWTLYDGDHSSVASGGIAGGVGGAGRSGSDADYRYIPTAAGKGAVGSLPGEPGASYGGSFYTGVSGTVATVSGDVIDPGLGGMAGHRGGAGGGGYAGGGGGSMDYLNLYEPGIPDRVGQEQDYGAGGGGSGFLAAHLTPTSIGTNEGDGFITFTYALAAPPVFGTVPTDLALTAGGAVEPVTVTAAGTPAPTLMLAGALPAGVSFDPATGVLSGAPTEAGEFSYTITASNGTAPDASVTRTITVLPAAAVTLTVTPSAPMVDEGGSLTFTVEGEDQFGNPVAVPEATLTSSVPTDIVDGWMVTFPSASEHTITATTSSGAVGSVVVWVEPQAVPIPDEIPDADPEPSAAGSSDALPATGPAGVGPMVVVSVVLLLVGGVLLLWVRRRAS